MQVTTEQIDPCKVAVTVTVEPEKVRAAEEKAFLAIAKNIQIPGFRKGKVPPQMARPYVDTDRVKQRAADALLGPAYAEALQESGVEPFGNLRPDVELIEMNDDGPLIFKALVPTRPLVTLGLFKGLTVERRLLQVTDADVDEQIDNVRNRGAEYPDAGDRSVQMGDVLLADVATILEGNESGEGGESRPAFVEVGRNIPDFDNAMVGMTKGETKTIEATYPDDFPDENYRGKKATFIVTVNEIRDKVLPELNDEFAAKIHPTAKTVEELKAAIRENLQQQAVQMADNDVEFRLVGQIVDSSQINFPDVLLRAEMQEDINNLQERLKRDKLTIEQFIEQTGRTAQQIEQEIATAADRRIRNSLILSEVARAENITVEEEDVDRIITERAASMNATPAALRAMAEKNNQLNQLRDQALTGKILQFIKDSATINERTVTRAEIQAEQAAAQAAAGTMISEEDIEPTPLGLESARPKRRGKKAEAEPVEETPATDATPTEE